LNEFVDQTHSFIAALSLPPLKAKGPRLESKPFSVRQPRQIVRVTRAYFSDVLMLVNLSLRVVPRPFTAAMIARAMSAAIRPYSMAVAADSSFKTFENMRDNPTFWFSGKPGLLPVPQIQPRKLKLNELRS
jgi:hypothetical protein